MRVLCNDIMTIDDLSLTLPFADDGTISLREGTVRSVDRSSQLLVVEVPTDSIERTTLAGHAGSEAGARIVVQTAAGRTYEGYIEVVAESATGRLYWCSVC